MKITLSNNPSFPPTGGQESVKKEQKTFYCSNRVILFIATIVLTITTIQGYTQGMMAPPSPNAQALARYAAVPVSYYTGTPAINIPLYTLSGKELNMPISLSYNASGHKVKDIASWVGLGWSLNAGGVITRIVRGLPDEDTNGYCGNSTIGAKAVNPYAMSISDRTTYFLNIMTGDWDGEPDMFYFNFMGRSGRFVIGLNGLPYVIPHQNLSIKPGICSSGGSEWIITDENGTRYIFGNDANSRESSYTKYITTSSTTTKTYNSSWYLSRMESANGTDKIYFSYQNGSSHKEQYRTKYRVRNNNWFNNPSADPCPTVLKSGTWSNIVEVTITPKYIKKIWNSFGSINFVLNQKNTRSDLQGARSLKSIDVKDNSSNVIKSYQLEMDYFSSGCAGEICKRLKLTAVNEDWQPMVSFKYNEAINLPARSSNSFDHWGYANNITSTTEIGYSARIPDASKMLANSIIEISYAQGAKTAFEFEPNNYLYAYYANGTINFSNILIGGLRIKSKIVYDQSNSGITTNYSYVLPQTTYSSGSIFALPNYKQTIWGPNSTILYSEVFSASNTTLFDLGGSHIGYNSVSETSPFFSTTYHFTSFNSNPDTKNKLTALGGYEITASFQPPFVPGDYFGWERGLLLDKTVKTLSGKLVTVVTNEYDYNSPLVKTINGTMVSPYRLVNCNWSDFAVGSYTLTSKPLYLLKTTTETYEPENNANKSTTIQEFIYNTQGQLSETKAYNLAQSASKQITKIKYVNDPDYSWLAIQQCDDDFITCLNNANTYPQVIACDVAYDNCLDNLPVADTDAKAILDLRIKHAINVPVEQLSIIQEAGTQYLVGATYTKFKTQGASSQMVVPFRSYVMDELIPYTTYQTSSINNSGNFIEPTVSGAYYKLVGTSNFSTTTGQLASQASNDGTVTSYGYDTKGILNSTSTTNGGLTTTASQVVTPLVGVTQKTDANGRQVNYTYDTKGRLKYVKDHDNNVVTRYRYNTEAPLTSQIEVGGSFMVGESVNFNALNPFDHGVSAITWGFDDGTVLENSTESISHTFNAAGLYTVSFTVTNPEYKVLSVTKTIAIYSPVSISMMMLAGDPFIGENLNLCDTPIKNYQGFSVNVTGGAPNKTYQWSYTFNAGNPNNFNPLMGLWVSTAGTYEIKCVVTDEYNTSDEITGVISAHDSSCGGPGGGGIY